MNTERPFSKSLVNGETNIALKLMGLNSSFDLCEDTGASSAFFPSGTSRKSLKMNLLNKDQQDTVHSREHSLKCRAVSGREVTGSPCGRDPASRERHQETGLQSDAGTKVCIELSSLSLSANVMIPSRNRALMMQSEVCYIL